MKNARAMAEAGAATILPEKDLSSDSLATEILRILGAVLKFLKLLYLSLKSSCLIFTNP